MSYEIRYGMTIMNLQGWIYMNHEELCGQDVNLSNWGGTEEADIVTRPD
jgi:hypothetical protein